MPATPAINGGYRPVNEHDAIPAFLNAPAKANAQAGRGQFVTVDLADGLAALNDGATPNQACAGFADPAVLSDVSSVAGAARIRISQRWTKGLPASEEAGDGFTEADFAAPFFIANENAPGKLSNLAGDNRSLGGLVIGLDTDGNPILFAGPIGWTLGRAAHLCDSVVGASHQIADAAANTATAERAIVREAIHGRVVAIEFIGAAVPADDTDYVTITVAKRDGAGGGAVTLGTYDSRAANQGAITAFVPAAFALSATAGALDLLETDIVTVTVAKGGSGEPLTGAIRLVQKVI